MKAPFEIEYREITPAQAEEWLKTKNPNNRTIKQPTVTSFARDMVNGDWIPNHQGIAFGDSGNLIDGQHRLAAIVRANIPLWLLVCSNVPERPPGKKVSAMGSIDRGAPRSIADVLKLDHGYDKHQAFIAQMVSATVILSLRDPNRTRKSSISQVLRVLELMPEDAKWLVENRPAMKLFNTAAVLTPFAWARPLAPAVIDAALEKFIKGAGLAEGDPMLGLRNYVMASAGKNRTGSDSREIRLRLGEVALYCLWHTIHGKPLGEVHGTDGKHQLEQITWFREKRREFIDKIDGIFQAMSEKEVVPRHKRRAHRTPERAPAPSAPPDKVTITPAAEKLLGASDVKLTPLAQSLVRGKEISERIHHRIGDGKISDGRSRKEVMQEIARRVR